jgi:hypothetical protein
MGALAMLAALTAPAAAQDKVKVGVFPVSSTLPYFVAVERGFFKEQNIETEMVRLIGGPPNVAAMITNQIDASAVLGTIEGKNGFVLRMNDGKMRRQLPQDSHRGGLIVDENTPLSGSGNLATQDQGTVVRLIQAIRFEKFGDGICRSPCDFENCRNHGPIDSSANDVGGRLLAQQERQRIDEDGLPCSRFPRQQVQAVAELHHEIVDYCVVLQAQFCEHSCPWFCAE